MSEQKEINIVVPDGYEIDEVKSTFQKIVFKKKERELPMSWADIKRIDGFYIDRNSNIYSCGKSGFDAINKNVFPSREEAEAILALSQLCQLRDIWNNGWKPDWLDSSTHKYVIYVNKNELAKNHFYGNSFPMSFETREIRDKFMKTFANLLEIAKPFL